jgi:hypothetical protein
MIRQFPSTISLILCSFALTLHPLKMSTQEPTLHSIRTPPQIPLHRANRTRIQPLSNNIIPCTNHFRLSNKGRFNVQLSSRIVVYILGLCLEIVFPIVCEFTSLWSIADSAQFPLSTHFRSPIPSHWEVSVLVLFPTLHFSTFSISWSVPRVSGLSSRGTVLGCIVVDGIYVSGSVRVGRGFVD